MRELALFAGAGGGILGGRLLGWRTVCAVEIEPYARSVLLARQDDGTLEPFPVWDDIRTFDGRPWAGLVDVVTGGFPCQDISCAGRGAGIDGERSGLWGEMARVIREVRPRFAFVENSPMLTSRGLHRVLGDLAEMGFNARWGVLGACDAGAPHKRERIWIVADAKRNDCNSTLVRSDARELGRAMGKAWRLQAGKLGFDGAAGNTESNCKISWRGNQESARPADGGEEAGDVADADENHRTETEHESNSRCSRKVPAGRKQVQPRSDVGSGGRSWWAVEPDVGRVADGVAARVDRLAALGNGQVPAVVRLAWSALISEWTGA